MARADIDIYDTPEAEITSKSGSLRKGPRVSVGIKLAALIMAVVSIFLIFNYISFNFLRDAESEMIIARNLVAADNDLNRYTSLSRDHLILADVTPEGVQAAIADSQQSIQSQLELLRGIVPALAYSHKGLRPLAELTDSTEQMETLLVNNLQPALTAGDQAGIERAVEQVNRLHDQQEGFQTEISASIQESITEWQNRHDQLLSQVGRIQLYSSLLAALFAFAVSFLIYRMQSRRLFKLRHAVDELASGELDTRVAVAGNDEISDVGYSVNRMASVLKKNTDELRHQRNRIRSIHQGISDGIIVYDQNGLIVSANPAAEVAVGKLEKELSRLRTTGIDELDRIAVLPQIVPTDEMVECWKTKSCTHPECPSFGSEDLRCWLQCGTHCYNEIQGTFMQKRDACERCDIYKRNGVRRLEVDHDGRSYKVTISPLLDDQGHEEGRVAVLNDITELRSAELTLRAQNSELLVLNDIAASLYGNLEEIDYVIEDALKKVVTAAGASAGVIATAEPDLPNMKVRAQMGINTQLAALMGLMPSSAILDLESEPETGVTDADRVLERWSAVGPLLTREGLQNPVILPFGATGKVQGVLAVADTVKERYADEDLRLLRAASLQIGVAIQNADLFNRMERSRNTWETTFDSMGDGVFVLDTNRRIVMANRVMADMLDTTTDKLIGKKCFEVAHDRDSPVAICPFDGVVENGEGRSVEIDEPVMGGSFTISINPVKDSRGSVVGAVHVISDVTEKNRLKEQLLQSEKMSAVGQLVSGVAHELNNPLTGVMGYSQLLLRRLEHDDEAARDLHAIIEETSRATKIVQNLLSFARKHQPKLTVVNINEVVSSVLQLRNYELGVKKIAVGAQLEEGLPETMADFHQLEQVLLNVVNNAVQAVDGIDRPAQIDISTSHDEKFIKVRIHDNGPGMSPETQKRIFDPFFTTKEVGKGTGLGLSICYGIIEEHGGRMEVDSLADEGSTISFTLPIVEAEAGTASSEEATAGAAGRSVLLVDNEKAIVDLFSDILTMDGHAVDIVENCSEALEKLSEDNYDNVITDISSSCIEGKNLYRRIQEIDPELAANVIFIADNEEDEEVREYLNRTGNFCLLKPFNLHDLQHDLREVMKSRGNYG